MLTGHTNTGLAPWGCLPHCVGSPCRALSCGPPATRSPGLQLIVCCVLILAHHLLHSARGLLLAARSGWLLARCCSGSATWLPTRGGYFVSHPASLYCWVLFIELAVAPLVSRAWFPGPARFRGQLPDSDGFPRISGCGLPRGLARRRAFGRAEFFLAWASCRCCPTSELVV